jgi:hypothetical protein
MYSSTLPHHTLRTLTAHSQRGTDLSFRGKPQLPQRSLQTMVFAIFIVTSVSLCGEPLMMNSTPAFSHSARLLSARIDTL